MTGSVDLVPPRLSVFPPGHAPPARDIYEGWVLKKRRKKMQGFARRYFTLKPDGVLVYSTHPGQTPRDSIPLQLATITSSERSHSITVDSGTKTFHIRCQSGGDFQKWMTAFRTFLVEADDQDDTATEVGSNGRVPSMNYSERILAVVQEMDKQIQELEAALAGSPSEYGELHDPSLAASTSLKKKKSAAQLKSKKEKEKDDRDRHSHHGKGDHGLRGLFHRKTSGHSTPTNESHSLSADSASPTLTNSSNPSTPSTATFNNLQSTSMSYQPSSSSGGSHPSIQISVHALRTAHSTLVSLLENLPASLPLQPQRSGTSSTHGHGGHNRSDSHTPTQLRTANLERGGSSTPSPGGGGPSTTPHTPRSVKSHASFNRRMRPLSLSTVGSVDGTGSIWYDADDGGLEFVDFDAEQGSGAGDRSRDDDDDGSDSDEDEARNTATSTGSRNIRIPGQYVNDEEDEDGEGDTPSTPVAAHSSPQVFLTPASSPAPPPPRISTSSATSTLVPERPKLASVLSDVSSSSTISLGPTPSPPPEPEEENAGEKKMKGVNWVKRTRLPAPTSGEQMSLFTMLKRNIGKDLSTVAFPVTFNEPLSLLQHTAEDLEYVSIIEKAIAETDPVIRLAYVAAFAVSGYACTKLRASRKPFNPLLGETFEDARYNFVSEKVSHHPPVVAAHASGDGWEWWCTSGAKNKFWGKSLEIIPIGTTYLKIGDTTYCWQKPSSFMRNLIAGEKYLEHCGFMTINTSSSTTSPTSTAPSSTPSSLHCTLEFKEGGFWGTNKDEVFGRIVGVRSTSDPSKTMPDVELRGRWTTGLSRLLDSSGNHLHVLWRAAPLPEDALGYYGFTQFAIGLNDLAEDQEGEEDTERSYLPPTDSRFRPDQRALELGNVDFAESEKTRVEDAQRARRKARADRGEEWEPRWFVKDTTGGKEGEWVYRGGYWEAREQRAWDRVGLERLW